MCIQFMDEDKRKRWQRSHTTQATNYKQVSNSEIQHKIGLYLEDLNPYAIDSGKVKQVKKWIRQDTFNMTLQYKLNREGLDVHSSSDSNSKSKSSSLTSILSSSRSESSSSSTSSKGLSSSDDKTVYETDTPMRKRRGGKIDSKVIREEEGEEDGSRMNLNQPPPGIGRQLTQAELVKHNLLMRLANENTKNEIKRTIGQCFLDVLKFTTIKQILSKPAADRNHWEVV